MTSLENDLKFGRVNFNRPILVTDILVTYDLKYNEVTNILRRFLDDQESRVGVKYKKSFVVHGNNCKSGHSKEIFKIVVESKLQECLTKLRKARSFLYSVEIFGQASHPAAVFQPFRICQNVKLRHRMHSIITRDCVGSVELSQLDVKPQPSAKANVNRKHGSMLPKDQTDSKIKVNTHKIFSVDKGAASELKTVDDFTKFEKRKDITQFFNNAGVHKRSDDCIVLKSSVNKDIDTTAADKKTSLAKEEINTSIQLFENDFEVGKCEESANGENLNILRKSVFNGETETKVKKCSAFQGVKRRRICDSDLEDEISSSASTPNKLGNIPTTATKCENFVDDDGYLRTVILKVNEAPSYSPSFDRKANFSPVSPIVPIKAKQSGIQNYFFKK